MTTIEETKKDKNLKTFFGILGIIFLLGIAIIYYKDLRGEQE